MLNLIHPPYPSSDVDKVDGKTMELTGCIDNRQIKNDILRLYLKDISIETSETLLAAGMAEDELNKLEGIVVYVSNYDSVYEYTKLGRIVKVKGVFEPFSLPYNEGQFDARMYYKIRGYDGRLKNARVIGYGYKYNRIEEKLRDIRESSRDIIFSYLDEAEAGTLTAMLLGDKTNVDSDTKELYQNAGISHVLALSGLHIATIGVAIYKLLRKIRIRATYAGIISSVIIGLYSIMTGLSTSTLRAFIMYLLAMVATSIGRSYDLLSATSLSAILILLENHGYAYDTGFLLSFGAVIAIGMLYPVLINLLNTKKSIVSTSKRRLSTVVRYILERVLQSMCISISITIVTLPIIAYSFFQISRYSIFVNLIIIPLMSLVLLTGFIGLISAYMAKLIGRLIIGNIFQLLSVLNFKITDVILKIYSRIGLFSTNLNGNLIILGRPLRVQIITYYLFIIVTFTVAGIRINKNNSYGYISSNKSYVLINDRLRRINNRKRQILCIITAVITLISCVILCYHGKKSIEIRNIYVGQGDCTLITGDNIPNIMIDGGSSDIKEVYKYNVVPVLKANGIDTIDYCFISHLDEDHISAIRDIVEHKSCGIVINNIIMSESALKTGDIKIKTEQYNLLSMNKKDKLCFDNLEIQCLAPEKEEKYDGNDSSLVLYLKNEKYNFSALFCGDISSEKERKIEKQLLPINYLKVAHHGSKYSTSESFLNITKPTIAVISAGVDNSYGHPHKETLDRLNQIRTIIYNTSRSGEVILKVTDKGMEIEEYLKGSRNY